MMGCAMLWWVSRGMTWTTRLVVAAVTLALIVGILLFERSSVHVIPGHEANEQPGNSPEDSVTIAAARRIV